MLQIIPNTSKEIRHSGKIAFSASAENVILSGIQFGLFVEKKPNQIPHKLSFASGEEKVLRNDAALMLRG